MQWDVPEPDQGILIEVLYIRRSVSGHSCPRWPRLNKYRVRNIGK